LLRQYADIESIRIQTGARIIRTIEVIESGSFVQDDLQFQQVFRDLPDPSVDGVATSGVDRLARADNFSTIAIFEHFQRNRKKIFTPGSVIDLNTQSGFMETLTRAMFGGMEKIAIKTRTMGAKAAMREKGKWVAGPHCLCRGVLYNKQTEELFYDLDPTLVFDRPCRHQPGDALLVRRAFELLVVEDYSYQAIADILGAGWTAIGIRGSLKNPIWIGFQRYAVESTGDSRVSKSHRRYSVMRKRADPPLRKMIAEPLIPVEMFEKAQEIIEQRSQLHGKRKKPGRYLLLGLLECECGKPWYSRFSSATKKRGPHESYFCSSGHLTHKQKREGADSPFKCGAPAIRRDRLDEAVMDIVTTRLLDASLLRDILQAHKGRTFPVDNHTIREKELARLKDEKNLLLKAYLKKRISEEDFDRESKELDSSMMALNTLYPKAVEYPWTDERDLAALLIRTFTDFRRLPFLDRQLLLRRAVRRITITARMISSITLSGGFLGDSVSGVAKLQARSSTRLEFSATPDLVIVFPQPIEIPQLEGAA